jgi:glycosyltransferase involved in cell wall biosynthesis
MTIALSIVTVCRNDLEELKKTITSVAQLDDKTRDNIEHIIVDGASTDGTVSFLNGLDLPHLVWKSEADSGISEGFNKGVKLSRGKYVIIINAGDLCEATDFANLVSMLSINNSANIFFTSVKIFSMRSNKIIPPDVKSLNKKVSVFHCGMIVDRSTYDFVGDYSQNYKLAMDYDWIIRALGNNVSISEVSELCPTAMNTSGVSNKLIFKAKREVFEIQWKYTGKLYALAEYLRSIIYGFLRVVYERIKKDTYIR